jgi:hypothetical protein
MQYSGDGNDRFEWKTCSRISLQTKDKFGKKKKSKPPRSIKVRKRLRQLRERANTEDNFVEGDFIEDNVARDLRDISKLE